MKIENGRRKIYLTTDVTCEHVMFFLYKEAIAKQQTYRIEHSVKFKKSFRSGSSGYTYLLFLPVGNDQISDNMTSLGICTYSYLITGP